MRWLLRSFIWFLFMPVNFFFNVLNICTIQRRQNLIKGNYYQESRTDLWCIWTHSMQRKTFKKSLYSIKLIPHRFQPTILHFPTEIVDSSGPKHRGRFVVAAKNKKKNKISLFVRLNAENLICFYKYSAIIIITIIDK